MHAAVLYSYSFLTDLSSTDKKAGSAITPATTKLKDKEHLKHEKDLHPPSKASKSSPADLVSELANRVRPSGTPESSPLYVLYCYPTARGYLRFVMQADLARR